MAQFLPRGVPSPQESNIPSPFEDQNLTIKKLLDSNAQLHDQLEELEADKQHFQRKLEEYIRYDREHKEDSQRKDVKALEMQIDQLRTENAQLQAKLTKEREISELSLTHLSHLSERDQRASLMHRLNELQAAASLCREKHSHQIESMRLENLRLKEEVQKLKGIRSGSHERPPSWQSAYSNQYSSVNTSAGYSSLPESLSSLSSSQTRSKDDMPNISDLRISNTPDSTAELKKIKKQLEKYKTANIELDQKLKDAKLELQEYSERRGNTDMRYRMDVERLRSEVAHLHSQLDRVMSENSYLRSRRQ